MAQLTGQIFTSGVGGGHKRAQTRVNIGLKLVSQTETWLNMNVSNVAPWLLDVETIVNTTAAKLMILYVKFVYSACCDFTWKYSAG